ncbi:bifunctional DNA primase/polymerase [Haloferax prahovense]|uniref:bifunctional DNA primase/polymerase n=1 Tax=Haloferax prahovense TaxID=381852 RepID=UPI000A056101|nr:bifunctional DNA primase/polymerase [Haloferax prahovense]
MKFKQDQERENLIGKLTRAGLTTNRSFPLNGQKEPKDDHDWLPIEEVENQYAVRGGKGLLVIDVDTYNNADNATPDYVKELPRTLTVSTPHGGLHLYYLVDESTPDYLKQEIGRRNPAPDIIEIRAHNQYVVGPGSVLNSCDKSEHDCSEVGEGRYKISSNVPIAELDSDILVNLVEGFDNYSSRKNTTYNGRISSSKITGEQRRLLAWARSVNAKMDGFTAWAQSGQLDPRPFLREAGVAERECRRFDNRSQAEASMIYILYWVFGDKQDVVDVMDYLSPPKWASRPDYRQLTIEKVLGKVEQDITPFEPNTSDRRGVSRETMFSIVRSIVFEHDGKTRRKDVTNSSHVQVGASQVYNSLKTLEKMGYVSQKREGHNYYWIYEHDEHLIDDDEFLSKFRNHDEIRKQRKEFLSH